MTATFCNVPTSPNNGGYGSGGGAAATSAGIAVYTKLSRLSGRKSALQLIGFGSTALLAPLNLIPHVDSNRHACDCLH